MHLKMTIDNGVLFKSCFKFREMDTDWCKRNWVEESYLYMKDWIKEINPCHAAWILDASLCNLKMDQSEWTKEFDWFDDDWETESETELNIHVRDWISELGDWETISDIRVRVSAKHLLQDNINDESIEIICPICRQDFDSVILFGAMEACQHKFCLSCIEKWSRVARTCPMDRIPFQNIIERYCGLVVNILSLPPRPSGT